MKLRAIIELPSEALEGTDEERTDDLVDKLIDALNTPDVQVLDVVEEGESAWWRSEGF